MGEHRPQLGWDTRGRRLIEEAPANLFHPILILAGLGLAGFSDLIEEAIEEARHDARNDSP